MDGSSNSEQKGTFSLCNVKKSKKKTKTNPAIFVTRIKLCDANAAQTRKLKHRVSAAAITAALACLRSVSEDPASLRRTDIC